MSAKMYKISDSNPIVSELDYDEYMENKSTYDSDDNAYVVTDAPAEDGMEADDIFYDNSTSGLSNRNVQGAIDSVNGKVTVLQTQNGSETLTTTAQTLSGAVNEIKSSLANITNVTSGTTSASGITYTQCGKLVMVHIKSLAKTTGNVTLTGLPTPATGDYISCYVGNGLTIVGYVEWNSYKWIYYSGEVSFGSFMYIAQ